MELLDGKVLSKTIKSELKDQVKTEFLDKHLRPPHLAAILVGNNGASETYVASKVKSCEQIGFGSTLIRLPENISQEELMLEIEKLNGNSDIDGFIVQLPLPKHIDEEAVIQAIHPSKDVDGFNPTNFGKVAQGIDAFIPATPMGILEMIKRYEIPTEGKHCVVIGRSNIVGKPMSILMARSDYPGNATVTLTHSRTNNLPEVCKTADILIVALGKPEFITKEMVKDGAVVIDVGITRVEDDSKKSGFALKGDVNFDDVAEKCSYITPVPGGVGLMTVTALLMNTFQARMQNA